MIKLTKKQELFCQEYMIDSNGGAAARRAGYKKKNAYQQATENLRKPLIKARLLELGKDTAEKLQITREQVIAGILGVAKEGEHEGNRLKAWDMLGKHTGIYEVDNQQGATQMQVNYYAPKKDSSK